MAQEPTPELVSLERRKALDSLPDLKSKLEVARLLCTHSARAEMVLRWLLEEIKGSSEVRTNLEAWELFASTARLLPPERLATLLAPFDILGTVRLSFGAVEDLSLLHDLLIIISGCVNFLLDMAKNANGAAIKAYLSGQLSDAALFVSIWFLTLCKVISNMIAPMEWVLQNSLLEPGLQIWDLRKRSRDEEEYFARECLVETAHLLLYLPVPELNEISRKRKRGKDSLEQVRTYKRALQTMVAKHVFLPARTAFFGGLSENETHQGSRGSVAESDLVKRLKALKTKEIKTKSSITLDPVQPAILDIALRCTPTLTPRQRLEENPWNEALFSALVDTLIPDVPQPSTKVICAMLRVVCERHSSLPIKYLEKLYQAYGRYDECSPSSLKWQLVAEIIHLAPTVYTAQTLATSLFDDMFKFTKDILGGTKHKEAEVDEMHAEWKDNIVAPLMAAYAQNRNLIGFTDIWHQQLMRTWPAGVQPVWSLLGDVFAPLAARHLTEAQIVDLWTRHRPILQSHDGNHEDIELRSSTIILHAILCGITSSSLVDKLWEGFDEFMCHMFQLHGELPISKDVASYSNSHSVEAQSAKTNSPKYGHKWSFFRKVFELWFPLWVTRQPGREQINSYASVILASNPVQQADAIVEGSSSHTASTNHVNQDAAQARRFLMTISNALIPYAKLDERALELGNRISKFMPCLDIGPLLEHPEWLTDLNRNLRNDKILDCIKDARKHVSNGPDAESGQESIRALVATALTHSQAEVLADLVRICLTYIKPESSNKWPSPIDEALVPLQILAEIPALALTNSQRERILDIISTIEYNKAENKSTLEWCLIVMVRLLEFPCPNAQLLANSEALWGFITDTCVDAGVEGPQEFSMSNRISSLSMGLIQRIMNHLLKTQGQTQPRKVLIALYRKVMQYLGTLSSSFATMESPTLLAFISVILNPARALGKELAEECIDHNVLRKYAGVLLREVKSLESPAEPWSEARTRGYLIIALRSLLPILDVLGADMALLDEFSGVVCNKVAADGFLATVKHMDQDSDELKRVAARCLSRNCRHIKFSKNYRPQEFASIAVAILSTGLRPKAHADILQAFGQACEDLDSRGRRQILESLLSVSCQLPALQLLRVLLSSLTRQDFDEQSIQMATSQEVFSSILHIAARSEKFPVRRAACYCIILILREKSFMTNQYTIEATLTLLHDSTRYDRSFRLMYLDICRILTVILQQHRSRIKDRLEILVKVLQNLTSCLFRPKMSTKTINGPTVRQAKALARVLQLLCSPPQIYGRPRSSDLVDETRKAQAHAGRYVQYVLHHYCSQLLSSTLAEGLRDALMPGLFAIVEAVEVNDRDGIKSLSAAMNSSERAVLRGVYDDYMFGRSRSE